MRVKKKMIAVSELFKVRISRRVVVVVMGRVLLFVGFQVVLALMVVVWMAPKGVITQEVVAERRRGDRESIQ